MAAITATVAKQTIQPVLTYEGLRLVNPIRKKKLAASSPAMANRIFTTSKTIFVRVCGYRNRLVGTKTDLILTLPEFAPLTLRFPPHRSRCTSLHLTLQSIC